MMEYSQAGKATRFDCVIIGSNPITPKISNNFYNFLFIKKNIYLNEFFILFYKHLLYCNI